MKTLLLTLGVLIFSLSSFAQSCDPSVASAAEAVVVSYGDALESYSGICKNKYISKLGEAQFLFNFIGSGELDPDVQAEKEQQIIDLDAEYAVLGCDDSQLDGFETDALLEQVIATGGGTGGGAFRCSSEIAGDIEDVLNSLN